MNENSQVLSLLDYVKAYLNQSIQELVSDSEGKLIKAAESTKLPYQTPNWAEKTLSCNQDVSLIVYEVKDLVNRYGENWPKHSEKLLKVVWVSYEIEGGSWQNDANVQKAVAFPSHVTKLLTCYQSFRDDREAFWLAFPILRSILDLLLAINVDLIKSARKESSKNRKAKKSGSKADQATDYVEPDRVEAENEESMSETAAETLIPILNELMTIKELSIYHKLVKEIATTMLKLFSEHFQHLRSAVLSIAVGAVKSFLTMKVDTALLSGLEQLVTAGFEMFQHYRAVDQLTMMQRLHLQRSPSSPLISYPQLCEASQNIKSVKSNWFLTTIYINNLVKIVYCAWKNYGKTTVESQKILHACIFGDHHVLGLLPLFHKFHRKPICNFNHPMTVSLLNGESFVSILKSVAMELVGEIMESIESSLLDQLNTLWREGNEFMKKKSQWMQLFANGQIMKVNEVIDTTVEASLNQFLDLLKGILSMFRYVDEKLKVLQRCFEKIIGHIRGLIQTIDPAITYMQVFTSGSQTYLNKLDPLIKKLEGNFHTNPSMQSFTSLWIELPDTSLNLEAIKSLSVAGIQAIKFIAILSMLSKILDTQVKRAQTAYDTLFKTGTAYEETILKHWETMRSDITRMEEFVKIVAETIQAKKTKQSNQSWLPTSFKLPTLFSSSSKPPTIEEVINIVKSGLNTVQFLRNTLQTFAQKSGDDDHVNIKEGNDQVKKDGIVSASLQGNGKLSVEIPVEIVDLSVLNDLLQTCKDLIVPAFSAIEDQFATFASKGEALLHESYQSVIRPLETHVRQEIANRLKSIDTLGCGEWMKTLRGLWSYFCVSPEAMNAIREGIKTMIGPGERPELVEEALAASTLEIEAIFDAAIQAHDLTSTAAKKHEIVLMHQQLEKFIAKWKMTSSHQTIKLILQQQKYTEKVNTDLKKHWLSIEKESVNQIESLVTGKEVMTTIMNNDEELLHKNSRQYGIKSHHEELLNGTRQLIAQDTTKDSIQTMKDSCYVVMNGSVASGLAGLAPVLLNYLERCQERVEMTNQTMLSIIKNSYNYKTTYHYKHSYKYKHRDDDMTPKPDPPYPPKQRSPPHRDRWEDRLSRPIRRSQEDSGGLYYPQYRPSSPTVKFGRESRFANRNRQLAIAHDNRFHMSQISLSPPSSHAQRASELSL